ncbi:helix-turn-helix transcriptional regulator [Pseudomonas putida]|uniref:helix-turn-helix transcriptional regulator n=2 Tax=Pseudomonas TaxID=286 RepID=UPI0034A02EFA
MQDEKTESLRNGDLQEAHRYLQYTFSILPAVRLIELNTELESRYKLTPKERAVAELLLAGESNKSIAALLGMELPTTKTHVLHIFEKLQVESRAKVISLLAGIR